MLRKREFLGIIGAGVMLAAAGTSIASTDYPRRPITLMLGFGAGGPTDVVARIVAQELSKKLGQSVVVDNKPGANGRIALQSLKNSAPDGYTLILASSGSLAIEPAYRKSLNYDVFKDFTVISPAARYPYVMCVSAASDIKSIDDLIKKARTSGKGLSFASAGVGADNHLAGEWFAKELNVPFVHVPFSQGEAASIQDMLSGGAEMSLLSLSGAMPHVRAGKLRAIGVASEKRSEFFPDVPTIAEATGKKDFVVGPWNGIFGPAKMDPAVAKKLSSTLQEIMASEEIRKKLFDIGQLPFVDTPQGFVEFIKGQQKHWSKVIADAKLEKLD